MTIQKTQTGNQLALNLEGRLDTVTAPQLEAELAKSLDGIGDLTLDFARLEYISSAGLRVLLATQKRMNRQGTMKLIHVGEAVMEVFDLTGFTDIMRIE